MSEAPSPRERRIGGAKLRIADDQPTFWDRVEAGTWEPGTLAALAPHLGPETTFLDLGAWVGPLTLLAASRGARVLAAAGRTDAGLARLTEVRGAAGGQSWRLVARRPQLLRPGDPPPAPGPELVLLGALRACVGRLSEREQMVLQLYFFEELNLQEIGLTLDVSAARICQIKRDAMAKIDRMMREMTE